MITKTTHEAAEQFADIIHRAVDHKERVILARDDKELVAVVPIEDIDFLRAHEERQDMEEALAALAEAEVVGTVPGKEVAAEFDRRSRSRPCPSP